MKTKLPSIQILRGFAAISVLLFHSAATTGKYFDFVLIDLPYGYLGVDFFFVLSGFIITYIHSVDIKQRSGLTRFVRKRVVRVIPFYWLVFAFVMVLYFPDFSNKPVLADKLNLWTASGWSELFKNIFLLPTNYLVVGVAWSLIYEMLFYTVFAFCIFAGWRWAKIILAGWLCLVILYATGIFSQPIFPATLASPLIIEFFLGCLAGYLFRNLIKIRGWLLAAIFFPAFTALIYMVLSVPAEHRNIAITTLMGLVSAIAVYMAATWDKEKKYEIIKRPILVLIGDASYSIYLTHGLFMKLFIVFFSSLLHVWALDNWLKAVLILVTLFGTLFGGTIVHLVIESPLLKYFNRNTKDVKALRRKSSVI